MEEIQGRLWEGVLPGVLRTLFVGRKTGLLSFSRKDERRRVRFRGGNIVSADSSVREDWMGEQLVRRGRLSREDLKRAVGFMLRDKRRLGVVLRLSRRASFFGCPPHPTTTRARPPRQRHARPQRLLGSNV